MAAKSSLLFLFFVFSSHFAPIATANNADDYLHKACSVARYRSLCIRSLSAFGHGAAAADPHNSSMWARAAISVTLAETERVGSYISELRHGEWAARGGLRARATLADCVECFGDAAAELHDALSEMRRLQRSTFEWQMSNVETWVSAALTNQNTCLDEFMQSRRILGVAIGIKSKVLNTTYLASNALALLSTLASSGGVN